ncbi:hypothetical protein ACFVZH_10870 [Streptomyces sp. NPDC059534]|uniref:hypothetical protein n=1 Tax=Streptomyces sp. NPDC059534 TaxID=3346859 RepID=UPI0036C81915
MTATLLALPACASSVDPIERLGRKAAERVGPRPTPAREARDGVRQEARERVREAVDAKGCEDPAHDLPERRRVTPQGDELALRLTEC